VTIFCDAIKEKYTITIKPDELATVHRRLRGDIIGKFIKTGPGSSFEKLTVRRGVGNRNPRPEVRIFANVLLSTHDSKMRFYASMAKKCGTIKFYEVLRSGRVGVLVGEGEQGKMIPINNFEDIKPYITPAVINAIKNKNRTRRNKKGRGGRNEETPMAVDDELQLLQGSEQED